ncbi:MAG TPA: 50S ribosomal protein L25 [Caldilineae bacterium]|nr:50S ribosomal protein L25 [Caldilineae bacterium]
MDYSLNVEPRTETGSKTKHVRSRGYVPAVVYGQGEKARPIQFTQSDLMHLLRDGGGSQLIELHGLGEKPTYVVMREVQRHPFKRHILHVDFYEVQMDVAVRTEASLHYEGESPVIKAGGVLMYGLERIEIECLPRDIPEAFIVDLTLLQTEDDVVRVSDLAIPEGVTILNAKPDDIVASVTVPRKLAEGEEEEEEFAEEEGAVGPEVISKGREEE